MHPSWHPCQDAFIVGKLPGVSLRSTARLIAVSPTGDNLNFRGSRLASLNASIWGRTSLVASIIQKGADMNHVDFQGMTPLHFAAQEMHLGIVRILLDAGCDPNVFDIYGNSPLMTAVRQSRDPAIALTLLRHGAMYSRKNLAGLSPKDLALAQANQEVLELMS